MKVVEDKLVKNNNNSEKNLATKIENNNKVELVNQVDNKENNTQKQNTAENK